jgi:predicted dehydrogenase
MKVLVIGFGVQGRKRSELLGGNFIGSVDPKSKNATYLDISDAPIDSFDAVFLCVPDDQKIKLIEYCILHKKHVLVEKPLINKNPLELINLQTKANSAGVFVYTGYNHRFEPHFRAMKDILDSQKLGKIFSVRMFYGNGTSQLVKASPWRDQGMGVVSDLAPHLLDTLAFWLGVNKLNELFIRSHNFETIAPDHAVVHANLSGVAVKLEMSLCMWRNSFFCDIIGDKGSAHISSLCKWGPSVLTIRKRVLPSGKPTEELQELEIPDPTWELEHEYFFSQILSGAPTNFATDIWIAETLREMEVQL